jgi:hypothetical protein
VLLVNEFSTFFLNYRQFLLVFKQQENPLYKWNSIAFFLAFFFSRIVFNTVVAVWVARAFCLTLKSHPDGLAGLPGWKLGLGIYLIGLFVVINALNLVWFGGIVRHVKRNVAGGPRNSESENTDSAPGGENEPLLKEHEEEDEGPNPRNSH